MVTKYGPHSHIHQALGVEIKYFCGPILAVGAALLDRDVPITFPL